MHGTSTATFRPRDVTSYYIIRAPDCPLNLSCKILLNIAFVHKTIYKGKLWKFARLTGKEVCEKMKNVRIVKGSWNVSDPFDISVVSVDSKCSCNRGYVYVYKKRKKVFCVILARPGIWNIFGSMSDFLNEFIYLFPYNSFDLILKQLTGATVISITYLWNSIVPNFYAITVFVFSMDTGITCE